MDGWMAGWKWEECYVDWEADQSFWVADCVTGR